MSFENNMIKIGYYLADSVVYEMEEKRSVYCTAFKIGCCGLKSHILVSLCPVFQEIILHRQIYRRKLKNAFIAFRIYMVYRCMCVPE